MGIRFTGFFLEPNMNIYVGRLISPHLGQGKYCEVTIVVKEDATPKEVGDKFALALQELEKGC